ncbi:alpha/beta hydrolase [Oscillatoria sp. FACHB-1407]|uniref:alpha/beta hydrolase n=1 Tax=Oscillatoria sp. FACHB-1407 TaxID=2692847 RepID=UPI001682FA59|nr:alpha/beta hydrolase [Oscillatoria sp. FACHB-1407]MBD2465403.1 alpha/beta hydrolase [Oscillatoria sp. FACHB-1407]
MSRTWIRCWGWIVGFASVGLIATEAIAAERVVWRYRLLQGSLSVEELTALAETGEVSPALRSYFRLARRNPQQIRRVLTQETTVNPRVLDRVLNSPIGNVAIDQVSQAIHTPSQQANRQAMRSALVLSASDDSRISLIEVIQNYPTEEIYVDGDRLADAYQQIAGLQDRLNDLLNGGNLF